MCLLSHISPIERLFVLKTLSRTQRATKVKNFVGFSLKPLRCRDPALPPLYGHAYSRPFFHACTACVLIFSCIYAHDTPPRVQHLALFVWLNGAHAQIVSTRPGTCTVACTSPLHIYLYTVYATHALITNVIRPAVHATTVIHHSNDLEYKECTEEIASDIMHAVFWQAHIPALGHDQPSACICMRTRKVGGGKRAENSCIATENTGWFTRLDMGIAPE